jgi:mono/diheme cytochrome c family protein
MAKRAVRVLRAVALALLLASLAAADEIGTRQVHFGELTYRLFCVGCHGPRGEGDGAVSGALGMPVGDLTRLNIRNGGVFPADEVTAAIADTSDVRGHRELAVAPWAQTFAREFEAFAARPAVEDLVARRIAHIVAYLESIQR